MDPSHAALVNDGEFEPTMISLNRLVVNCVIAVTSIIITASMRCCCGV